MLWYSIRYGDMKYTYLYTYKSKILDYTQEKCIIRNFSMGLHFQW